VELLSFVPAVEALAVALRCRNWRLVTAESCTGGLIAAACTALPGSSDWFEGGLASYSNEAKVGWLGVPAQTIQLHGAVSEAVALGMARGALDHSTAQLALSVTGIAGPGGAVPGKPVGTVWMAWGTAQHLQATRLQLNGDRDAVRAATVHAALARLLQHAQGEAA
jgi:nicotinamide-nucleotide amidase